MSWIERTILADGKIATEMGALTAKLLTLTSKRLIVQKKKGLFSSDYEQEYEFLLVDIVEVYAKVSGFTGTTQLILLFKDGHEWSCRFSVGGSDMLFGTLESMSAKQRALTDRWVNAINNQMHPR